MKDVSEALAVAQSHAHEMLVEQYDAERNIPLRATSHTDLWPGDRWTEAYLAASEPETALAVAESLAHSIRPDGSVPHLMQGSHKRAGVETRFIDRQVYRLQGNGAERLPNGEWVTRRFAPPTWALSALALHKAGLEVPEALQVPGLTKATEVLFEHRATNDGLLSAATADELTNSVGVLNKQRKAGKAVVDPATNALAVLNDAALQELAARTAVPIDVSFQERASQLKAALYDRIGRNTRTKYSPEAVLAAARLQDEAVAVSESRLTRFFGAPDLTRPHVERTHLSMADSLEAARLLPDSEAAQTYLRRVLPKIALLGASGFTRFEGVAPTKNAVNNRSRRKQVWLPTAAQVVQIDPAILG